MRFAKLWMIASLALAAPGWAQYSTPMRDVDNAARQPVNFSVNVIMAFGTASAKQGGDSSIKVPAGKRLVIETISIDSAVATGQKFIAWIGTIAGGAGATHILPGTVFADFFGDPASQHWVTNLQVRMYADPNTAVQLTTVRDTVNGPAQVDVVSRFAITGYYVNLP